MRFATFRQQFALAISANAWRNQAVRLCTTVPGRLPSLWRRTLKEANCEVEHSWTLACQLGRVIRHGQALHCVNGNLLQASPPPAAKKNLDVGGLINGQMYTSDVELYRIIFYFALIQIYTI